MEAWHYVQTFQGTSQSQYTKHCTYGNVGSHRSSLKTYSQDTGLQISCSYPSRAKWHVAKDTGKCMNKVEIDTRHAPHHLHFMGLSLFPSLLLDNIAPCTAQRISLLTTWVVLRPTFHDTCDCIKLHSTCSLNTLFPLDSNTRWLSSMSDLVKSLNPLT